MGDGAAVIGAAAAGFEGAQCEADALGSGRSVTGFDPAADDEVEDVGGAEWEDLVAGGEGEAEEGLAGVEGDKMGEITDEFVVEALAFGLARQ
jgi:hypothetical protein